MEDIRLTKAKAAFKAHYADCAECLDDSLCLVGRRLERNITIEEARPDIERDSEIDRRNARVKKDTPDEK
jgi:hypothetical protein